MTTTQGEATMGKLPRHPSGWMRGHQLFAISAYWFATNLHWGGLLLIIVPSQMQAVAPTWKANAQGLIIGAGSIAAMVVPLLVGALSDRCASRWGRRRPYMVAGVAVNLLGLLVLWMAGALPSLWLYLVGYLIVAGGNNVATGAYSGVIPDLVLVEQRGEASGWMAAMTQTGTIVGAVAAGKLMNAGCAGASYAMIAAVLVVFLTITALGMHERPLDTAPEPLEWRRFLRSLWVDPRKHPDFAWVWITRALVTMGMWTVQPFIQYYLDDVIHVRNVEETTGYVLATLLVGATITGLLGGRISDRVGRKRVVYVANGTIAAASLAFIFGQSLAYAYVVAMVYGLGFGAYFSVDWALGCDVLPSKVDAAKDMGVWHISMVLPQTLAPPMAGLLLSHFGQTLVKGSGGHLVSHYTPAGYSALFVAAAGFLLLGAVLLRNVRGVR